MTVKSDGSTPTNETTQLDRQIAWLIFAIALALYLRTAARDVLPGDPGEFQFAAWNFGVAHATGYPLYLMLGGAWQHLLSLVGVRPALSLNVLSALFGAATVALMYSVTVRWLSGPVPIRRAAALVAAAFLVANPTFWSQALIAEVYALHALLLVLMLLALQRIDFADKGSASPALLCLLVGLSLAHHATTLLLLPGLALALWILRDRFTGAPRSWLVAALLLVLPLLLYVYVPLRATPQASPWLFPHLGADVLPLYGEGWQGFRDFISGRSISVGFYGAKDAFGNLGQAFLLWRLHLGWPGLVLAAVGIYAMAMEKRSALLACTLTSAALIQLFNLFYAIQDILVYYIPLYLFAALWVGFGAAQLGRGLTEMLSSAQQPTTENNGGKPVQWQLVGVFVVAVLLYFPFQQMATYISRLDQSDATMARESWEAVLAATPNENAILVSNDRNEIVPLYYFQNVEQRRTDLTGIFPLIAPEARFADIGATVDTALAASPPAAVYLTKGMPGMDVRFELQPGAPPLFQVLGPAVTALPETELQQQYGPLTLQAIEAVGEGESASIRLYWLVNQPLDGLYTTTVQVFAKDGSKIAQGDAAAGGLYYPTSLWKPGEQIVESHAINLPADSKPASLLVSMYATPSMAPLAPALIIDWSVLE
jgi:hypothetical protein